MIQALTALALLVQPPAPAAGDIARLSWMAGCWVQPTRDGEIQEQWMPPGGGVMLGMSRTTAGARTASYEFIRIAPMLSGTLAYVAAPSGQPAVTFPLKTLTDREVVFENLAHDFPQRIIYRRNPDGSIKARIEGLVGGRQQGQDFDYKTCR
jgi:hypothetical protein